MNHQQISLKIKRDRLPFFLQILSVGFKVNCRKGQTLNQILYDELRFEQKYIDHRIQTVFLNGKAVDNLHSTLVQDGYVIALSAAMPGLVGATLRKGGQYSTLRKNIDCAEESPNGCQSKGFVRVKLFNLIAREIGPEFLKQGILMDTDILDDWLKQHHEIIRVGSCRAEFAGQSIDTHMLSTISWKRPETIFRVNIV